MWPLFHITLFFNHSLNGQRFSPLNKLKGILETLHLHWEKRWLQYKGDISLQWLWSHLQKTANLYSLYCTPLSSLKMWKRFWKKKMKWKQSIESIEESTFLCNNTSTVTRQRFQAQICPCMIFHLKFQNGVVATLEVFHKIEAASERGDVFGLISLPTLWLLKRTAAAHSKGRKTSHFILFTSTMICGFLFRASACHNKRW